MKALLDPVVQSLSARSHRCLSRARLQHLSLSVRGTHILSAPRHVVGPRSTCTSSSSRSPAYASSRPFSQRPALRSADDHGIRPPGGQSLLQPDDLYHSFTTSPLPGIRKRAALIRQNAYCPHPHHRPTRSPETTSQGPASTAAEQHQGSGQLQAAHVHFECPDCGIPVYCSEEHWMDHYEEHLKICDTLRQINEDEHDLRSGRFFPEFNYSRPLIRDAVPNMTNWDTFLYSREYEAIDSDRSIRHVTKLLTYPVTIGSVLHELSPYHVRSGGRLTTEGLKSLSALRYSLHPPRTLGPNVKDLRPDPPPVRIFVLGARAESSLPREAWLELSYLFPDAKLHVIFIGPESMANRDAEFPLPPRTASNPFGAVVEDRIWPNMKFSTIVEYYHTLHRTGHFAPFDPYFDCFVLFHPGLGHPASSFEWAETLPLLLETKVPIIATGYTQFDMERDCAWVDRTTKGEFDMLLAPGENTFRSWGWDLNDMDPQDITCGNWGVWAFRGKRYETETVREPTQE